MNICIGITKNNVQCTRKVKNDTYCYQHRFQAKVIIETIDDEILPNNYIPDDIIEQECIHELERENDEQKEPENEQYEQPDDMDSLDSTDSISSVSETNSKPIIKTICKKTPNNNVAIISKIMKRYEQKKEIKERRFLKKVYTECYNLLMSKKKKY